MYGRLEENTRKPPSKTRHVSKLYAVLMTSFGMLTVYFFIRFNAFATSALTPHRSDSGAPLILTEFIDSASASAARQAAKVQHTSFGNQRTYTGFLTVNKTFDKNLFMWFCPSESDYGKDPVILWLQGGPGGSSLFGLFKEHGPFKLKEDSTIINNEFSWTKNNSMLYIDNPAGTGYSYTKNSGYDHDEQQIGQELTEAIRQFFLLFPELQDNPFFIAGESYAGKYVPATAYEILRKNIGSKNEPKINLQGLAIGNGKIDPINQLDVGEFAFQHGLVDSKTKRKMNELKEDIKKLIVAKKFKEATEAYYKMSDLFEKQSGFENLFNYLYTNRDTYLKDVEAFVQRKDIRKAIHVGETKFHYGEEVGAALEIDNMKSVVDLLPPLLEQYRFLFYNGQLDARLPYPCMVNFLENLKFNAAEEYKKAERKIWRVNGEVAGYSKKAGNMTELLVRDAGHMVPVDQPEWALDMIMRFTRNKGFE